MIKALRILKFFLEDHQIENCAHCHKFTWHKNTTFVLSMVAGAVIPLCRDCYEEIFTPFKKVTHG